MQRREFITLLGGATAAWPLVTTAQQNERMRRIGVLWPYIEADSDSQSRIASLRQALQDLGWTEGRNVRFDYRWGASAEDRDRIRRYVMELVALAPDVIVAGSGGIAVELRQMNRTVPIVFPTANDPVGTGLAESLARLQKAGVPCAPAVEGHSELFLDDPHAAANDMITIHQHPVIGRMRVARHYVRCGNTEVVQGRPTPLLGEHTREVLQEAGFTAPAIADLYAKGVVKTEEPLGE